MEFLKKKKFDYLEELNKLRKEKDRNATAHPIQKASIDKVKEEKMNFETMFYTELNCNTEVMWTVVFELLEAIFKHYFMERTRSNDL